MKVKLTVYKNDIQILDYHPFNGRGLPFSEGEEEIFIGRSNDCHVLLDDASISRHHLKLIKRNDQVVLVNLSSYGNSQVNGQNFKEVELKSGNVITAGPFQIKCYQVETQKNEKKSEPLEDVAESQKSESIGIAGFDIEIPESPILEEKQPTANEDDSKLEGQEIQQDVDQDFALENEPQEGMGEVSAAAFSPEEGVSEELMEANDLENINGDEFSLEEHGAEDNRESLDSTQQISLFLKYYFTLIGEFAPFDHFNITENEVFIGRDKEKCQLVLPDTEVSSVHAVVRRIGGILEIEDLKSSNGILVNGKKVNKLTLKVHDEVIIGSTSLTLEVESDLLQQEKDMMMPVEEKQIIEREEVVEEEVSILDGVNSQSPGLGFPDPPKGNVSLIQKFKALDKKQKIYVLVGILVLVLLLGEEDTTVKDKTNKDDKKQNERSLNPEKEKEQAATSGTPDPLKGTDAENSKKALERLDEAQRKQIEDRYILARDTLQNGQFVQAIYELNEINKVVPGYKESNQLLKLAKDGLAEVEAEQKRIQEEFERKERQKKVKELVTNAKDAVEKREVTLAEAIFSQILSLDPENIEVSQLRMQLEAYKQEQERIALMEAQKKAERERQVNALLPGKTAFLKKDWFKAIIRLEEFLALKGMDEDLVKEASQMLNEAKQNLDNLISPILAKAQSLKEGQDLKGSYLAFSEVLRIDPAHAESLNQISEIRELLEKKARTIYRDALISESLSLFDEAKEKFLEVKQISPNDSEYFRKAEGKLKKYGE